MNVSEIIEGLPGGEKTDGFKFAVTLLAAFGVVLLKVSVYFQDKAVDECLYIFIIKILSWIIIISLFLLIYIFLKGYYFEIYHPLVGDLARMMYEMAFLLFFSLLILHGGLLSLTETNLPFIVDIMILGIIFITLMIIVTRLGMKAHVHGRRSCVLECCTFIFLLLICWIVLFPVLFAALSNSPLQGDVVIDMDRLYCESDTQIPVSMKITGVNTALLINLSKENYDHTLSQIDSIKLEPIHNPDKTASGENLVLVGNALDYGNYNVFINTTNLTGGYYELVCLRKDEHVKGFYILNNSQQP